MDNVSEYIESITERVIIKTNNALIDWSEAEHILALEEILIEDGIPFYLINELVLQLQKTPNQLTEEEDSPATKKAKKLKYVYKGGDVWLDKENGKVVAKNSADGETLEDWSEVDQKNAEKGKEPEKIEPKAGTSTDPNSDGKSDTPDDKQANGNTNIKEPKKPKEVVIKGKTKTLTPGDPTSDKVWNEDLAISDDDFVKNMKKAGVAIKEPPFKIDAEKFQANIPTKYRKLLERIMSVTPSKETGGISAFTGESAGAGTINSQAGEILTMVAVAFKPREDWSEFAKTIEAYIAGQGKDLPENKKDKNSIVKLSWIDAATKSAESIERVIADKYGEGAKVMTAVWDTEKDFKLIGGQKYKDNKGYSTDIYLKVKDANGDEELLEVSLKKDTETFLLNSTISQVYGEGHDLTKMATDYRHETNSEVVKAIKNNIFTDKELAKFPKLAKRVQAILENYENNKPQVYADTYAVYQAISVKAKAGNKTSKVFMDNDRKNYTDTRTKIISSMVDGDEAKKATLKMIDEKLPLSSVADNEEVIVLGDIYIDGPTLKKILGTDDISTLRKHIVPAMRPAKGGLPATPILIYKTDNVNDKPITIATLKTRQKPRGSGSFLFDVKLHKDFIKKIKDIRDQKNPE